MNKNTIKKFATEARRELISRVGQRALKYGISDKEVGNPNDDSVGGHLLSSIEKKQRAALIEKIKEKGYEQVMEEVAYTWFNRFSALRFMEVNGYLPTRVRVFTDENNAFKPQILTEAIHMELDGLDMEKVYAYKEANDNDELYKYLLITQCNALNSVLPGMFQKIADYTELLFPDNLLREGSVVQQMIELIPEDDWTDQVQIIGWLYQYYNTEKKDEVISLNKAIEKDDIPAATQLFTTDWVVRYLIDNSVGRYWIERNPASTLADKLTYLVKPKNGTIKTVNEKITPQDVTTFDPCVGSGHFLIYAFDVLMKIYVEYGYSERDAAAEIVKNNLFGLDIDSRASQLAYFSVMMKARQYDRRFFSRNIQPHIFEIVESNTADRTSIEHFYGSDTALKKDVEALLDALKDAKEYGSILQMPAVDFGRINERFAQLGSEISMYNTYLLGDFQTMIRPAEIMSRKYAVVATNPPYMNKFGAKLKDFVNSTYKDYSGDMFSVFMYRNFLYCKRDGFTGFMTPFVWMFIRTYEKLRKLILLSKSIVTMVQMEYSAFEEATVPICSFVLRNGKDEQEGLYFKLSDFKGGMDVQNEKVLEALRDNSVDYFYENAQKNLEVIPGTPFAFWLGDKAVAPYLNSLQMSDYIMPMIGMVTGDTNRFLRFWQEVEINNISFGCHSEEESQESGKKWFPYQKGGNYRRWYGNNEYVVNWENSGYEIKFDNYMGKRVRSHNYNGQQSFVGALTWSSITSSKFSARIVSDGFLYDVAGPFCQVEEKNRKCILAYIISKVADMYLNAINPTINFVPGTLLALPLQPSIFENENFNRINEVANECIEITTKDWDAFETSWDFQSHPLAPMAYERQEQLSAGMNSEERKKAVTLLSKRYRRWEQECEYRFTELKKNEEELNRIFIDIYGLQDELTPDVEDKDVTVRKADLQRDVRSLLSYAVGCMFGRYSLDVPGLVYAGGTWDASKYTTFQPDKDAIIPICDDEYFDDDIVGRFVKFIEVVYGKETLEENLKFIADALGGKGQPREIIRNYFLSDFYSDHCKIYQKRPIYWMFDSGKKNGFKCLIYMHRYQPDTIARIRTDYVHEQQARYRTAIADLETRITNASTSERVKLNKQLKTLNDQATEIHEYEEKIHHLADQMISIDLDDGVKKNYAIFQDVLAKIK